MKDKLPASTQTCRLRICKDGAQGGWCLCFYSFSNEPNPQDWKPVCCWRRKLLRVGWEEERQSENLLWEDLDGPKWGRQGKRGTKLAIGKREDVFLLLLD